MENALSVTGLKKHYRDFCLDDINFTVPTGSVVGLIGENGAGKSTTLNCILGLVKPDAGNIQILGKPDPYDGASVRRELGIVFDGDNFQLSYTPKTLRGLMRILYPGWNDEIYTAQLKRMALPENKSIRKFSRGMKAKMALAVAFSHEARLLILDEPTSGLDPVVRDEVLDLLLEYVAEGDRSVLISSHITTDLKKVADSIVLIHEGSVIFQQPKDDLIYHYGILRCTTPQFQELPRKEILRCRRQNTAWEVLVADRQAAAARHPDLVVDPATLDEIMLLYIKGKRGDAECGKASD